MIIEDQTTQILNILGEGGKIRTDSRAVVPGDIFIATHNENTTFYRGGEDGTEQVHQFDSNRFAPEAWRRGARLLVLESIQLLDPSANVQEVSNGVEFLKQIFQQVVERDNKFVVGVTGSTGKSTLTEMVRVALGADTTYKHLSDRPTPISIPVRALNSEQFYHAENLALEMPMDGIGQIATLCDIATPDVGIILGINDSHIVQLGSMEAIVQAKLEMAYNTKPDGTVVINGDDPWLSPEIGHIRESGRNVLTFGRDEYSDVRILGNTLIGGHMHVTLEYQGQQATIQSQYIGESLSYSLAAAVGAGLARGINLQSICERLSGMQPLPGRMSSLHGTRGEIIFDDTRIATPQSTEAIIRSILPIRSQDQRLMLVQGPILRSYQHGRVTQNTVDMMGQLDQVVIYGETSWLDGLTIPNNFVFIQNEDDLTNWYNQNIQSGDIIAFKGSEQAHMWDIVKTRVVTEEQERVYDRTRHD